MVRAPCCDKVGLKKGPWSADEDQILVAYITTYGHGNWRALPKHAGLLRCGKSCRLRWTNYLCPDIKRGNFSKEEEEMLVSLHEKLGNRWSAIAARLPGRTDNEIKNVWHTHIKKRLTKHQKIDDHAVDAECCKPNNTVSSKGARVAYQAANSPMSPECRSGITSSSGTDVSSLNNNAASMISMASSQDVFDIDIDESFWSEALSMDQNSNVSIDVPMSSAAVNLAKEDGDGDDSMNFWLSILMEAGDF